MEFSLLYLLAAFGGGIVGAAIGALPSFIFCGFAAIVGSIIAFTTGDSTISNLVAWGPILGPQIAFAGGAAAAVYAARKGKLANGRDIATALMGLDSPDVLLVGGLFGAIGYLLWWLFSLLPDFSGIGFTNPIALSIIVNAIIARLVFGKTGVFGKVRAGDNRWLASDVANWIPWQSKPLQLLTLGAGAGLVVPGAQSRPRYRNPVVRFGCRFVDLASIWGQSPCLASHRPFCRAGDCTRCRRPRLGDRVRHFECLSR